ncbi:MAG: hypothetical protein PHH14_04080 [Candidatus Margulisbacteria bacterium]|nr:hypothetical protein [Candidatus Margulisiibacteriota bacterium]
MGNAIITGISKPGGGLPLPAPTNNILQKRFEKALLHLNIIGKAYSHMVEKNLNPLDFKVGPLPLKILRSFLIDDYIDSVVFLQNLGPKITKGEIKANELGPFYNAHQELLKPSKLKSVLIKGIAVRGVVEEWNAEAVNRGEMPITFPSVQANSSDLSG